MNPIEIGTRVHHPENDKTLGTIVEIALGVGPGASTPTQRARVKWDDVTRNHTCWDDVTRTYVPTGETYVDKGKRTWIALDRLLIAG